MLEGCFLFAGCEEALIRSVISHEDCWLSSYEKDHVIFSPRSFLRGIALVLSGKIQVTKEPQPGRRLLMSELESGAVFGAATLFNDSEAYVTTLTALAPSRVFFMGAALITELLRENFTVTENYLRYLSGRLHFLNRKIDFLAAGSGSGKLLSWLRQQAGDGGSVTVGGSLSALAASLSMGRASLYRAIDELSGAGLIRRQGKTIYLL